MLRVFGADANGLALVHKRLGEIYADRSDRSDRSRTVGHLQAVAAQWAGADAELHPVVNDVRARIRELGGQEGQ